MSKTHVSLGDGTPITIRAVEKAELDHLVLRCWPDRETVDRLTEEQGTIGMAAWEGDRNVAQLHCYRIDSPDEHNRHWPDWNDWWTAGERPFTGGQWAPPKSELGLSGPIWCHACFHVGRTQEAPDANDIRYLGQGIGTALCKESVRWAQSCGYAGVVAPGAADGLLEFARWSGRLPWTTYAKLGFRTYMVPPEETADLPGWVRGQIHEPIASEIKKALETRPVNELLERVMVLEL